MPVPFHTPAVTLPRLAELTVKGPVIVIEAAPVLQVKESATIFPVLVISPQPIAPAFVIVPEFKFKPVLSKIFPPAALIVAAVTAPVAVTETHPIAPAFVIGPVPALIPAVPEVIALVTDKESAVIAPEALIVVVEIPPLAVNNPENVSDPVLKLAQVTVPEAFNEVAVMAPKEAVAVPVIEVGAKEVQVTAPNVAGGLPTIEVGVSAVHPKVVQETAPNVAGGLPTIEVGVRVVQSTAPEAVIVVVEIPPLAVNNPENASAPVLKLAQVTVPEAFNEVAVIAAKDAFAVPVIEVGAKEVQVTAPSVAGALPKIEVGVKAVHDTVPQVIGEVPILKALAFDIVLPPAFKPFPVTTPVVFKVPLH